MDTRHGASGASPTATATAFSGTQGVTNKPLVFSKMESLVREMQDPESGIPIRSQKLFLTSVPSAFIGYDLVGWLMDRLEIEDSAEAIHLANLLCQYGYFFPVGETRSLIVKDDSSLYRFQTPYYWPSQNHNADTTDYAIYLTKRQSRNKQKHALEDYELEAHNKLKKGLQHKWDFILMQAEEQVRLAKDRKKGDKIVTDSQERAYWRVYRPPPGFNNCLENAPVPDRNNMANRVKKKTVDSVKQEIELITKQIERSRLKVSVVSEALLTFVDTYFEYDYFLVSPQPANPWITDDITFWILNESLVEVATEKRVRRWAISFSELVNDPTGLIEFTNYLRKEYCHENIRFWQAVLDLRYGPAVEVCEKVKSIYEEFLKPGAPCEINIDGKTMEITQQMMKTPSRYTYDAAAEHVYVLLLKKDCYLRFLRSEYYKNLLANAIQPLQKKRFFSFGGPGKKKATAVPSTNSVSLQAQTPQPLKRHGSDEQAAAAQGGGSTGESTLPTGGTALLVLQPRVDCDPPYRGDLAAGKALVVTSDPGLPDPGLSGPGVSGPGLSSTSDRSGDSDVCPWDTEVGDNVCPWETPEAPSPSQKGSTTPSQHPRLQQTAHHSLPPKGQLSKPRPDRSKSFEVTSATSTSKTPLTGTGSYTPSLVPIRGGSSPLEGSPLSTKGEKAQSVDVCPKETQPPAKKVPSVGVTPKEGLYTSLAPGGVSGFSSERRASEGVLRMALGVCPLEDVLRINVPPSISTGDSHGERGEVRDKPIDFSVRSGHLRELLCLQDSKVPQTTPEGSPTFGTKNISPPTIAATPLAMPKGPLEISIATSMAAITMGAIATTGSGSTLSQGNISPLVAHKQLLGAQNIQEILESPHSPTILQQLSPKEGGPKEEAAAPDEGEAVLWEEDQPQKAADVCPWEDDSLTPTWL